MKKTSSIRKQAVRKQAMPDPLTLGRLAGRRLRELGYSFQPREAREGGRYKGRFIHPLRGVTSGLANSDQMQVIRSAYHTGEKINKYGGRAAGLVKDVAGVASGRERERDARGVPKKRTWEKAWFKNAVAAGLSGAAVLAGAHAMRKNPALKARVESAGDAIFNKTRGVVKAPSWMRSQQFGEKLKARLLDVSAPDWDVRDQRGRSARVFAPGSRPRDRREKKWHEKIGNQRKVAAAAGLAAALLAGAGGYVAGKRSGSVVVPAKAATGNPTENKIIKVNFRAGAKG
ncbi:MAG: hypothetical protein LBH01_02105 [Verrucomicrobiales bacterium]|jgi:hypothetical protein|nr:hypothetical protein [Verrucomicrobiales bacterium]